MNLPKVTIHPSGVYILDKRINDQKPFDVLIHDLTSQVNDVGIVKILVENGIQRDNVCYLTNWKGRGLWRIAFYDMEQAKLLISKKEIANNGVTLQFKEFQPVFSYKIKEEKPSYSEDEYI